MGEGLPSDMGDFLGKPIWDLRKLVILHFVFAVAFKNYRGWRKSCLLRSNKLLNFPANHCLGLRQGGAGASLSTFCGA